jgi:acyl-CoA dehydrogenase
METGSGQEHDALEDGIARIMAEYGDDYWLERDSEGGFPEDFYRAMVEGGWLGIGFQIGRASCRERV